MEEEYGRNVLDAYREVFVLQQSPSDLPAHLVVFMCVDMFLNVLCIEDELQDDITHLRAVPLALT